MKVKANRAGAVKSRWICEIAWDVKSPQGERNRQRSPPWNGQKKLEKIPYRRGEEM
jgi:hypothetical protein